MIIIIMLDNTLITVPATRNRNIITPIQIIMPPGTMNAKPLSLINNTLRIIKSIIKTLSLIIENNNYTVSWPIIIIIIIIISTIGYHGFPSRAHIDGIMAPSILPTDVWEFHKPIRNPLPCLPNQLPITATTPGQPVD